MNTDDEFARIVRIYRERPAPVPDRREPIDWIAAAVWIVYFVGLAAFGYLIYRWTYV